MKQPYLSFLFGSLVVLLDQLTKFLFTNVRAPFIHYTENTGIFFGLLKWHIAIILFFSFVVLSILIYVFFKTRTVNKKGLSLLIGGLFSNTIDRAILGHAIDFIDFSIFPIFNFADIAMVTGVLLILFGIIKEQKQ